MIKFAEFSSIKFNEHFRLYISLSVTVTFLSDFSEKASWYSIGCKKQTRSITYGFPDLSQSVSGSYNQYLLLKEQLASFKLAI